MRNSSGEDPLSLVFQLALALNDARQIRVHWVDLFQRPAVETSGDHDMDEVENFHGPMVVYGLGRQRRNLARRSLSVFDAGCQTSP